MSIEYSINEAFRLKKERDWSTLYFAVDLHNTILINHYSLKMYPHALDTLVLLSRLKDVVLILFTSTRREELKPFHWRLKMSVHLIVDYVGYFCIGWVLVDIVKLIFNRK